MVRDIVFGALVLFICLDSQMACGDDDGGGGSDGDADGDTDTDTDTDADTDWSHDEDIQPIWDSKCAPCHISNSSGGLSLADAYSAIVDVPASVSGLDQVEPGDTSASYLWHKLQGTQGSVGGSGNDMPATGSLTTSEMDAIEGWITDGAAP